MFTVIQVLMGSYLFFAFLYFISHSLFHAFKCYFCGSLHQLHLSVICQSIALSGFIVSSYIFFSQRFQPFSFSETYPISFIQWIIFLISYMDRDLSLYPISIAKYSLLLRSFTISPLFHVCNTKYTIVRCVS